MRRLLLALVAATVVGSTLPSVAEPAVVILELDGLSRISYGSRIFVIPSGGAIRLNCEPSTEGAVAVRVSPGGIRIAAIDLAEDGGRVQVALADVASGFMRLGAGGAVEAQLDALVEVTVSGGDGDPVTGTVPIRLTTAVVEAWDADGTSSVEVEGMPAHASSRGIQLVGSATAGDDDPIAPGAAVSVVLSGALDRMPPVD